MTTYEYPMDDLVGKVMAEDTEFRVTVLLNNHPDQTHVYNIPRDSDAAEVRTSTIGPIVEGIYFLMYEDSPVLRLDHPNTAYRRHHIIGVQAEYIGFAELQAALDSYNPRPIGFATREMNDDK